MGSRLARCGVALGVLAATTFRSHAVRADIVDRIVAIVEDSAIFLSDLQRRIRPFERQLESIDNERERATRRAQLYRETLDRMVDDALIRRAATRLHVTATDTDVDRMIDGIARQRGATSADLYAALEHEGVPRSDYREFMEAEVLRLRVLNQRVRGRVNITDNDVAEEYRRRARDVTDRAPFHAAHIFAAFPENPTAAQIADTQHRAEQFLARLRAGENFGAVARRSSEDESTRAAGGDLGTIDPTNEEDPPPEWLVNAMRTMQPGQYSTVVRGENGYHVFRLITREPANVPALTSVRTDLYNDLLNREMARQQRIYLRELRNQSTVIVRL